MGGRRINIPSKEAKRLYEEGYLSISDIARRYNCSGNAIALRLREQNAQMRHFRTIHSKDKYRNSIKKKMESGWKPIIIGWWKGKKHSEEHNKKIYEGQKKSSLNPQFKEGHIPWNKGLTKKIDERIKQYGNKIRKAHIGNHHTEEHRRKISKALKKSFSDTRFKKGDVSWNTGLTKRTDERVKRTSKALTGRKHSEEWTRKVLKRRIPSSLEEKFQSIINKYNLPYKYVGDGSFILERYNPDFINTNNEKIAVEVYARYYKLRNYKMIEEWKNEREIIFNKYGWRILFFNEVEVNEKNVLEELRCN